jgi:hypothetical protein
MQEFDMLCKQSDWRNVGYIIADKTYHYSAVRQQITNAGKITVIPRRKGALCPGVRDKTRSVIERFFGKVKEKLFVHPKLMQLLTNDKN